MDFSAFRSSQCQSHSSVRKLQSVESRPPRRLGAYRCHRQRLPAPHGAQPSWITAGDRHEAGAAGAGAAADPRPRAQPGGGPPPRPTGCTCGGSITRLSSGFRPIRLSWSRMSWFEKIVPSRIKDRAALHRSVPGRPLDQNGPACDAVLYRAELEPQPQMSARKCSHHMRIGRARAAQGVPGSGAAARDRRAYSAPKTRSSSRTARRYPRRLAQAAEGDPREATR